MTIRKTSNTCADLSHIFILADILDVLLMLYFRVESAKMFLE